MHTFSEVTLSVLASVVGGFLLGVIVAMVGIFIKEVTCLAFAGIVDKFLEKKNQPPTGGQPRPKIGQ